MECFAKMAEVSIDEPIWLESLVNYFYCSIVEAYSKSCQTFELIAKIVNRIQPLFSQKNSILGV